MGTVSSKTFVAVIATIVAEIVLLMFIILCLRIVGVENNHLISTLQDHIAQDATRNAELQQSIDELFRESGEYAGEFDITYYCPCELCCGAESITATGTQVAPGQVAVDKNVIPLGSKLCINGKVYTATDTGVEGRHIDICVENHQLAIDLGTDTFEVWVMPVGDGQ